MKRALLYARVSSAVQTTENQKIRLVEYAERHGFVYDLVEEVESSGKTRPKKYECMQKLRNKEYDTLIIWKIDRWARSSYELLNEIMELHNKGVEFISLSDSIDLSSATGKLQFQVLSAFAEFERNLIRERTNEGLNRARSQGKRLGRPPGKKDTKPRKKSGYYMRYANG